MIDQKKVSVTKLPSFKREEKTPKKVDGKEVKVEVDAKQQQAESIELTAKALANANGVYEKERDGDFHVIGTLQKDTPTTITVKVPTGVKSYKKRKDFEYDDETNKAMLKGKMVRLEVKKNQMVESLEMDSQDQ
ncbi:hypothetical protein A374_06826 [Fictibacillus macauensis ZFHKF-1]|uniref:Uncharacterized protein n=1 Tax=Fictibacillus macauensis ZFHKF-1 TaxID=1196324 RepID=I8UGT5_9BACL|nr:hypothetical protein [Fictibacillus macauensis]EIT86013.1 hypothetical protein A374_06826 [Fictibacillus macauensis ZFHKF-1]